MAGTVVAVVALFAPAVALAGASASRPSRTAAAVKGSSPSAMAVATSTGSRAKMAAAVPGGTFCSTCAATVGCGREGSVRLRVVRTKPISSNKRRETPAVATLDGAPSAEGRGSGGHPPGEHAPS